MKPPDENCCHICDQTLSAPGARCLNSICNAPDRQFEWIIAIAMKTGPLEDAILKLKDGRWGWGFIFARVILGFLYDNLELLRYVDAIIPVPSYLAPGKPRKGNDHAGWVIEQAMEQDDRELPFVLEPPLIVKTRPTAKMRFTTGIASRRELALDIYDALTVPDPRLVAGKTVMVYDDVFTGGHTLNEVARRLKEAGARKVLGLTLSRQPWNAR